MLRLSAGTAALAAVAVAAIFAESLLVSQTDQEVRINAPNFHFLTGKPLDRMHAGNTVAFNFQLSALADSRTSVVARAFERYLISYDLWEQTYSVSRMRTKKGQASHLTAPRAEAWCIEGITLPAAALPKDEPISFRLEVWAQDAKASDPLFDEPGLSLVQLIEIFSRAGRAKGGEHWKIESAAITLRRGSR
jgi:hypothetical protein